MIYIYIVGQYVYENRCTLLGEIKKCKKYFSVNKPGDRKHLAGPLKKLAKQYNNLGNFCFVLTQLYNNVQYVFNALRGNIQLAFKNKLTLLKNLKTFELLYLSFKLY